MLFALTILLSLATMLLAQPDDGKKGQATDTQTANKKKKHHKKKHKPLHVLNGQGSMEGVTPA